MTSHPILVTDYETPSGHVSYAAFAHGIPGCVVRHVSRAHAINLVIAAYEAVESERAEAAAKSELQPTYVYNYLV